jgi:beta-galactosidase GanA
LILNGQRLFNFGGEFHTFRIPVPELWVDILEKFKAMGMNSVSMYNHWVLQTPNATTIDFYTGAHELARFYEYAKDVGIFVTARPGPYINAELSAGGMSLWITTGGYGALRVNDTRYTAAWTPYMQKMADVIQPYLVTQNGTVHLWQIENKFPNQWSNVADKRPVPTSIA